MLRCFGVTLFNVITVLYCYKCKCSIIVVTLFNNVIPCYSISVLHCNIATFRVSQLLFHYILSGGEHHLEHGQSVPGNPVQALLQEISGETKRLKCKKDKTAKRPSTSSFTGNLRSIFHRKSSDLENQ